MVGGFTTHHQLIPPLWPWTRSEQSTVGQEGFGVSIQQPALRLWGEGTQDLEQKRGDATDPRSPCGPTNAMAYPIPLGYPRRTRSGPREISHGYTMYASVMAA